MVWATDFGALSVVTSITGGDVYQLSGVENDNTFERKWQQCSLHFHFSISSSPSCSTMLMVTGFLDSQGTHCRSSLQSVWHAVNNCRIAGREGRGGKAREGTKETPFVGRTNNLPSVRPSCPANKVVTYNGACPDFLSNAGIIANM